MVPELIFIAKKFMKEKISYLIISFIIIFSVILSPVYTLGQEQNEQKEEELDDILSGFDDMPTIEPEKVESKPEETSWWSLDGFLRFDSSYNYSHDAPETGQADYRGISKLRTTLQLEVPVKLPRNWKAFFSGQTFYNFAYRLKNRDTFSGDLLDLYESQAEIREAYVSGSPWSGLDIKIGRQIIVWGFADYSRVVDVLNPLDNREPGLVDIEDLRLPVSMSRVDYSYNNWRLTGVAVHEIDFNKDPLYNSDFSPFSQTPPDEAIPSSSIENTELGVALTGNFSGWDVGFYGAYIYDDSYHVETVGQTLGLRHSRLNMGGFSANVVSGSWIWKTEAAWFNGLEFFNLPGETRSRLDALFGFEYSGISDTTIAVEIVNQRLINFEPALELSPDLLKENLTQYIASYRADFLREQLHLTALLTVLGSKFDLGAYQRLSAAYDMFDAFTISGGVLIFYGGEKGLLLDAYKNNDRLFAEAKYSF